MRRRPVGHLGIEPSDTCSSDRTRQPAGSWPADVARAGRIAHPWRKGRESDPQGSSRCSPVFGTGAVASRLAFPGRKTVVADLYDKGMSRRLDTPETRICRDCFGSFTTVWAQRLCMTCKYNRAKRGCCDTCGIKTGVSGRRLCGPCRYGPDPVIRLMDHADLAWLAAIIEGEGTFGRNGRPGGQVRVVMTDQDIVRRLEAITGIGRVHGRGQRTVRHKPTWEWCVTRRGSVGELVRMLAPFLLERRRRQIAGIVAANGDALPAAAPMTPGDPASWAWIAGLIEGEGWMAPGPTSAKRDLVIGVESTDRDVIDRLADLAEAGRITAIHRHPEGGDQAGAGRSPPARTADGSSPQSCRTLASGARVEPPTSCR